MAIQWTYPSAIYNETFDRLTIFLTISSKKYSSSNREQSPTVASLIEHVWVTVYFQPSYHASKSLTETLFKVFMSSYITLNQYINESLTIGTNLILVTLWKLKQYLYTWWFRKRGANFNRWYYTPIQKFHKRMCGLK